jgi:hypothetical protein
MSRPLKSRPPASDFGETTALDALAFLSADEGRLERFLALSGLGPNNLRRAAAAPGFLSAILDYVINNDILLVEFAGHSGLKPEDVLRAAASLEVHRPTDEY